MPWTSAGPFSFHGPFREAVDTNPRGRRRSELVRVLNVPLLLSQYGRRPWCDDNRGREAEVVPCPRLHGLEARDPKKLWFSGNTGSQTSLDLKNGYTVNVIMDASPKSQEEARSRLRDVKRRLDCSNAELARFYDVHRSAVTHWLNGDRSVPKRVADSIPHLEALADRTDKEERSEWIRRLAGLGFVAGLLFLGAKLFGDDDPTPGEEEGE